jgi:hypothetical protein
MKQFYTMTSGLLKTILPLFLVVIVTVSNAQQVSGIITDYNSFWKTAVGSVNPVKPVDSHNLLAFTYNGVQYSTGANDQLLSSNGETFVPGDFWALPVEGITGTINSNTKVGWGELKDGIHNGIGSLLRPDMDINRHLTDGVKGLDLGTCIANLPAGNLTFYVNNILPSQIGDGIPDILVTQIADPGGADRYSFVDTLGVMVGNSKDITFTNISPVGNWIADFYQTLGLGNLLTLIPGYTNTQRPIRLWAADLSEFGITAANYQSVHKFKVQLSGNSDLAFAAYNNKTFTLTSTLPVKLTGFTGKKVSGAVNLAWTTHTEENSDRFTIERSIDNNTFVAIGEVNASGNTSLVKHYGFTDAKPYAGLNYYRLKMTDKDGTFTYSPVVMMQMRESIVTASVFPNPCTNNLIVSHPQGKNAQVTIYSASGIAVARVAASNSTQTSVLVQNLTKGIYHAVWQTEAEKIGISFIKN